MLVIFIRTGNSMIDESCGLELGYLVIFADTTVVTVGVWYRLRLTPPDDSCSESADSFTVSR